uniref:TATA box-binding protein-associated factor RNA polymerase I subunit C isoform X3 n=1 Tax=Myxine glutinosa TaxID=7769 RepID=UPI00358EE13A
MDVPRGSPAFPSRLFPTFYETGPVSDECVSFAPWTVLGAVQDTGSQASSLNWLAAKSHGHDLWTVVDPVAWPLLPPNENIQDVQELSQPERDSLYNLAGYCVDSIRKNQKTCDDCISQVIVAEGEEVNQAAELTVLKEYKQGCLVHVSEKVINMLVTVEAMFRGAQDAFMAEKNVATMFVERAEQITRDVHFPTCHNLKAKLLTKFINTRLHIFFCKIRDLDCTMHQKKSPVSSVVEKYQRKEVPSYLRQVNNMFEDYPEVLFHSVGEHLEANFTFRNTQPGDGRKCVSIPGLMKNGRYGWQMFKLAGLLGTALHEVPPRCLSSLLNEDLQSNITARFNQQETATGGSLQFEQLEERSNHGVLAFATGSAMDTLGMHPSDQQQFYTWRCYFCGLWKLPSGDSTQSHCIEVVGLKTPASCLALSPHLPGEAAVVTETGAAYLWRAEKGLQLVLREKQNLYFNALSNWRWCHFTAHPRVLAYTDRTGVAFADCRVGNVAGRSLFRIGATAGCHLGERVALSQHLPFHSPFHMLVSTQSSAYLIDERMPDVPVVKWDHGLGSSPIFAHAVVVEPRDLSERTIVLGTRRSEVVLLNYTGGVESPWQAHGLPLKLSGPSDWLGLLSPHRPREQQALVKRLDAPGAGVTVVRHVGDCRNLSILHLSEAGDIFQQTLHFNGPDVQSNGMDAMPISGNHPKEDITGNRSQGQNNSASEDQMPRADSFPCSPIGCFEDVNGVKSLAQKSEKSILPVLKAVCKRWATHFLRAWKVAAPKQHRKKIFRRGVGQLPDSLPPLEMGNIQEVRQHLGMVRDVKTWHAVLERRLHIVTPSPTSFPNPVPDELAKDSLSQRLVVAWRGKWCGGGTDNLSGSVQPSKSRQQPKHKRRRLSGTFSQSSLSQNDDSTLGISAGSDSENILDISRQSLTDFHCILSTTMDENELWSNSPQATIAPPHLPKGLPDAAATRASPSNVASLRSSILKTRRHANAPSSQSGLRTSGSSRNTGDDSIVLALSQSSAQSSSRFDLVPSWLDSASLQIHGNSQDKPSSLPLAFDTGMDEDSCFNDPSSQCSLPTMFGASSPTPLCVRPGLQPKKKKKRRFNMGF